MDGRMDYTPVDFFTLYGHIVPLNIYAETAEPREDLIVKNREEGLVGAKTMHMYSTAPDSWNIPSDITYHKPTYIEMNQGSFFLPHRDKFGKFAMNKDIRLLCFTNNTHPHQYTYIVDDKITNFQAGRWYAMNTNLSHYGFCFADGTVHYACDIQLTDERTRKWLIKQVEYCDKSLGYARK